MSNFLFYLASFALVLGVLIVVHEFGHYGVARLCGVRVLRFSIGFGRPLFSFIKGQDQTEWAVGAFPLGGYVKMLDEREGEVAAHELHRAFNRQSVGKRMAIVAAGPLANLLLAVLVYWLVFYSGSDELRPILGDPPAATAAATAGISNGDVVRKVDGREVVTWQDFRWALLQSSMSDAKASGVGPVSGVAQLEVLDAQHETVIRRLDLSALIEHGYEGDPLGLLGVAFFRPKLAPVLGKVLAGSVAESAGLQPGDQIVSIDGKRTAFWSDVAGTIRAAPGRLLTLEVSRNGTLLTIPVTPELHQENGQRVGLIGVGARDSGPLREDLMVNVRYDLGVAFAKALQETWDKATFSVVMMGKMLVGQVSWRNLSGPITIADYAGQSAKLGADYYLKFLALVSISLGVLNLLPIPVLDGGHLLYYMIEFFRREPVSERVMQIGQQIGLALLLLLMVFAFYNDINRMISG